MTITEALAQLKAIWPAKSFSVEVDVWSHYHDDDGARNETVAWSVYDAEERKHYSGPTLESAMAGALEAANVRRFPDRLAMADASTSGLPPGGAAAAPEPPALGSAS